MPDYFEYVPTAWRRRRKASGLPEEDERPPVRRRGLGSRLGLKPYHRNPVHVLLANPGVIAALLIMLALAMRVMQVERTAYTPPREAQSYLVLGGQIAQHGDYTSDHRGAGRTRVGPTAFFAPAYPYLLGGLDWATGHRATSSAQVHADRLAQAVLGTLIVGLIGLIALELFGADMALLAMALAALFPPMIEMSSVLAPETLMTIFMLAAVLMTLRLRRSPDPMPWTIATGIFTGLAALAHPSAILLLIPIGVAVSAAVTVVGRRRVAGLLVLAASTLLALSPWLIRDGLVMHRFVPITDGSGITLASTYNPTAARAQVPYAPVGYRQVPTLADLARHSSRLTEAQLSSRLTGRAVSYIAHHPSSVPGAVWHNSLRLLNLEGTKAWHASAAAVGLGLGTARFGVYCFWALCLLALLGVVAPGRLRAPRWFWAVPIVMWLSASLVNGQTPEFRTAIDPFLILLGAGGVARIAGWVKSQPARPTRIATGV